MADNKKELFDAVVAYKVDGIKAAVEKARKAGMPAGAIIDAMGAGMTEVGIMFERGKLFLPHVLSAAQGMKSAMEILGPELKKSGDVSTKRASVAMGTVEGDVHDIGKSICSTMLQCAGFDVHDLGRDVPNGAFMNEIKKGGCTMIGMSALMTTTMTMQKAMIELLKAEGIRKKIIVMVGGAPVTQAYADKIGADIYGNTATETVGKAKAINK